MTPIRWVSLSDAHFGAESSLLSNVPEDAVRVEPTRPSPVLVALVDCLRSLVEEHNPQGYRPRLVLNGDALEYALAHGDVAAMAFEQLIQLAFTGPRPVFDDTILYVPGNHDHHVWETTREQRYAAYVATSDPDQPLERPSHAMGPFATPEDPRPEAQLLTSIVRRCAGDRLAVEVAYPNLGLTAAGDDRLVIFHHGHFVEPIYRLMSDVKEGLFPGQRWEDEVPDLESDNFAWIDFLWSTFGRSLDVTGNAGLVYLMSRDPSARDALADNLGDFVGGRMASRPWDVVLRPAARLAARRVARRLDLVERANPSAPLSAPAARGLASYLSGPLRQQLRESPVAHLVERADLSFVFGHTHKPFEAVKTVAGYPKPVTVVNSGGWVVDSGAGAAAHGAAVALVGDDGRVASLRMIDFAAPGGGPGIRFAAEPDNGFGEDLARSLDLAAGPWAAFRDTAAAEIARRRRLPPALVARGVELSRRGRR